MNQNHLRLLFLLLVTMAVFGCDTRTTAPESEAVVEAYLKADAPLPPIRLSRTVAVDSPYTLGVHALRDADVYVQRLGEDRSVVETVPYRELDSTPGVYRPLFTTVVQTEATYRLRADRRNGPTVTATTTVPGPIELDNVRNDTTAYQSPEQTTFTVEIRQRPERQNVFTLTTTSLLDFQETADSTLVPWLTPFYADRFNPDEDSLKSFRINSSGLLTEGNFEHNSDGTITITLPWLAVAFLGPNEVAVNVLDDNYYDLIRSQEAQQTSFAPGEIPNIIDHVDGGTGIFGSYAQASAAVFIQPPSDEPRSEG